MRAVVAAGSGFLLAVLWFDLMFDVQVRRFAGARLPDEVLGSIAAYYRRVTTEARPRNRLVAGAMVLTLAAIVGEIVVGTDPAWLGWVSLPVAAVPIVRAATRTVPRAVRLGRGTDPPEVRSELARAVHRDHRFCLWAVALVLALQLAAR
jgi:hypothetical protein